jgi:hypothetical protein
MIKLVIASKINGVLTIKVNEDVIKKMGGKL